MTSSRVHSIDDYTRRQTLCLGRLSNLPLRPYSPQHPDPSARHHHPSQEEAPPQPSRTIGPQSEYRLPATKEQYAWEGSSTIGSTDRALPSIDEAREWFDTASPVPYPISGSEEAPPHDRSVVQRLSSESAA